MLGVSALQLHFTPSDVAGILQGCGAGQVKDLEVRGEEGALRVALKVTSPPLPFSVPVELRFTVEAVTVQEVRLGVDWSASALVPGVVIEQALRKAFSALPGKYAGGALLFDMAELMERLSAQFTIAGLTLGEDGVRVALQDVVLDPAGVPGPPAVQPVALVPAPAGVEARLEEHQSYYRRLRARVATYAREKAPDWAQPLVPWLLAVPDFFALLVRLFRDNRVPPGAKALAGVAVAYFISPVDLIPDLVPLLGHIDDLALALFALEQIAAQVPEQLVQEHWPGDGHVLQLVSQGTALFTRALPARLLVSIRRALRRA